MRDTRLCGRVVGGGTAGGRGQHNPSAVQQSDRGLLVGLRWQAAGGRQRSRGAPRVADCLLHVRHPVGEIAGEAMPTNDWLSTLPEDNRLRDLVEPGQAALAGRARLS